MIKTRFAPSPTGNLHIGSARTAIVSWLISQKLYGSMLLRIEDTDTERSKPEYTQNMLDCLKWLNIDFSEGPIYQSQRLDRYKQVALDLVKQGKAYYCYSQPEELQKEREAFNDKFHHDGWKYTGKWRNSKETPPKGVAPVIRLKVPLDGSTQWKDLIKGGISISNDQFDDFIILRSDGSPTYNFCVVVDDSDMNISHVIRGEDHVSNTPKQIIIYNALNKKIPTFGHIPLIFNEDGTKQSKRDNRNETIGDDGILLPKTNLSYYMNKGILSNAMVNYLLYITCNDLPKEVFTKDEFVDMFDLTKLGNTPIQFDLNKLVWFNQQHIKLLDFNQFNDILKSQLSILPSYINMDFSILKKSICERSKLTSDFIALLTPALNAKLDIINQNPLLKEVFSNLISLDNFNSENIYLSMKDFSISKGLKVGDIMKPLREDIFNNLTLPIAEVIEAIGKEQLKFYLNDSSKKLKI